MWAIQDFQDLFTKLNKKDSQNVQKLSKFCLPNRLFIAFIINKSHYNNGTDVTVVLCL